jgi:hypothetical protein
MDTFASTRPARWLGPIISFALALSMALPPAHAQEASGRAGLYIGAQATFQTQFGTNDLMKGNVAGGAIYAEKIWESNNAVRVRYAAMASETFSAKTYDWNENEVLYRDKLNYAGGIADYLHYFDKKYVPYVFAGIGVFNRHWMDKGGRYPGLPPSQGPGAIALHFGAGWDFAVLGRRAAIEFNIRHGMSKEGKSFEASFCLPFKIR